MLLLAVLAAMGACGDAPTAQQSLSIAPARMDIVSGNGQSGVIGTALPEPVVVRVLGGDGQPVPEQIVNFKVTSGGGSVFAGTALTDGEGVAQEHWTLGPEAGSAQALEARAVDPATGSKVVFATFSATAVAATVDVASVSISPSSASIAVGATRQLSAVTRDAEGDTLTGRTVTWTSSNGGVASVSASGLVTAKAAGSATVTATSEGKSATAAITVTAASAAPVATVSVSPTSVNLVVGGTTQLSAVTKAADGTTLSGRTVTWQSSNTAVAAVSSAGMVTARAAGSATVTATSEGKSATANVAVTAATAPTDTTPPGIPGSPNITTSNVSADSFSITATWGSATDAVKYRWTVGSNSGAFAKEGEVSTTTVTTRAALLSDANGYWFCTAAVDAAGNSSPDEACNGFSGPSAPAPAVSSVSVSPTTASLAVGTTRQLSATAKDASGGTISGKSFAWSSSNTTVATVSSSGLVTARAAGSATVTASVDGKSGASAVTVTASAPTVSTVSVSPTSASLAVGATYQLAATAKDATGATISGKTFSWSSNNTSVATVSSAGLVTARAAGSATITASVDGKSGTSSITGTDGGGGGSQSYPNEPAGFTRRTENDFSGTNGMGNGWNFVHRSGSYINGLSDSNAPASPSRFGRAEYRAGYGAGGEPFSVFTSPGTSNEIYVSFWFRLSPNWYGHPDSGVNKILHIWNPEGTKNVVYLSAQGSGNGSLRAEVRMTQPARNLTPNVASVSLPRGQWIRWELRLKPSSSSNGEAEWWITVPGQGPVKVGDYRDVNFSTNSVQLIEWAPTWGGMGGSVPATQYMDIDHIYMSAR